MEEILGTAILLAGGRSSRMGEDKQRIRLGCGFLVDDIVKKLKCVFDDIVVVTMRPELYQGKGVTSVSDDYKGVGPIAGLHAGLKAARFPVAYLVACDMPVIPVPYMQALQERIRSNPDFEKLATWVVRWEEYPEPFHGAYSKWMAPELAKLIEAGVFSLQVLNQKYPTEFISRDEMVGMGGCERMFYNFNTPDELEHFLEEESL